MEKISFFMIRKTFFFRSLAPLSAQKISYISFENIDSLEVYLQDLDSGDKTVVTENIDFLSLGLLHYALKV